mgnify:CR=1 FL=1
MYALIKALEDQDHDVRRQAADALGQIGDASTIQGRLDALRDLAVDVPREGS